MGSTRTIDLEERRTKQEELTREARFIEGTRNSRAVTQWERSTTCSAAPRDDRSLELLPSRSEDPLS